jgi:hypothetical protein
MTPHGSRTLYDFWQEMRFGEPQTKEAFLVLLGLP